MHRYFALLCLSLLLSSCASHTRPGGYYQDDGPSSQAVDVARIPDAVPRDEPLSSRGNKPYAVNGRNYQPLSSARGYHERGVASWYGKKFHGRLTSSGEPYDMHAMTAAHKTLPLPSYVRVRNLENGRSVVVRVNDRGPFLHNRLIDLSYAAAIKLGIAAKGTGIVEIDTVFADDTTVARAPLLLPGIGTAEASVNAPAPPAPRLFLQVGAFTRFENADSLRARLEAAALDQPVAIQTVGSAGSDAESKAVYRVRIGPFHSVVDGDRLTERIAQLGVANAIIVVE